MPACSELMNAQQLKAWILRRLGAPFLKVELCDANLDDVVEEAKRWFTARKGVKRQMIMPIHSNVTEYELPDDVEIVLDVAFPVPPLDISLIFSPFLLVDEKVPYDVFAAPSSAGLYSSFTQTIAYVEMAKRVLGAESEWRQEGRKLVLLPRPRNESAVVVDFKGRCFTIEQLGEWDHDMLKRYALASAKADLGRIRSKYATYPGATGEVALDGERLLEEAKDEIEKLTEELLKSGYPMLFQTG